MALNLRTRLACFRAISSSKKLPRFTIACTAFNADRSMGLQILLWRRPRRASNLHGGGNPHEIVSPNPRLHSSENPRFA